MKKQINPRIKAHLIRSAFYVLLLLAVCVIPFALAQRNTTKATVAKSQAGANQPRAATATATGQGLLGGATQRVIAPRQPQMAPPSSGAAPVPLRSTGRPAGACGVVQNGGFETGDFPPWTDTGDTSFTSVINFNQHSGTFALESGPSTSDGFIDQVLPTVDGQGYDVTFWLQNADTSNSNRFGASFGSVTLVPEATQSQFGYTQFTFTNVIPGANADLHFIFFNPPSFFYLDDVCVTPSGGGTPTPTPTPTATPGGCQFNVLIVYSDLKVQPVTLHDQIAAEPDVVTVDYFDAQASTPTLAQLTPYNIVVCFSNSSFFDAVGMGNVLADYADAGGTVVAFNFDWFGPPFGLDGRWITDGYTPFVAGGPTNFNNNCLGTYDTTHPLMQGIDPGSLCAFFRHTLTLTAGAVSVAEYQDAEHLCAYNVLNGHTGVGLNAYVGDGTGPGNWSGPFGRVVVNAGRWVGNCQGGTPTPTPTPSCAPAAWQEVAPMPTDLYGAAGASDGTNFYAAGGYSFSQGITLAVLNKFNPGSNSWTPLSPMPQSAALGCGVYYPPTNKFYVFGGEDAASGTNYNLTQIYDIASDTWSMGANMPDVRSFEACGYVPATGMIYVVSGYSTGQVTDAQNTTWQYDPVGNSWTDLTATDPYPHAAGGFAYGVINDKLYVAGGRDANIAIINNTYEFDPQAAAGSRYTQKADEPGTYQNNVPGSASAQNLLWVYGGGNPFATGPEAKAGIAAPSKAHIVSPKSSFPVEFLKRLFGRKTNAPDTDSSGRFYDPSTDTWTASPNMNEARSFSTGGAITNSLIIAAGGYNGASTVASAETENLCAGAGTPTPTPTATPTCPPGSPRGSSWAEVNALPFAARGPFCVSDGTFYYIGGGYDGVNVHSDLLKYDPVANTYTPLASAPDQFFLGQAVYYPANNKIYSIAGFGLGIQTNTTRIYDIASNTWTTGTALPEPNGLSDHATGLDSGIIYIAGGFNGSGASNTLHIYNIAGDSWTTGAAMPTAVYLPGFGAINGKFYVASGNNGSTEVPDLQIYDIASGTWSAGAPVPTPVTAPGCTVIGGKLYLFGGAAPFPNTTTITQIYDPGTDSWTSGPNMVIARLWFYGGALDDSSILAPGGDNAPGIPINDNEILNLNPCPTPTPTATATATATATPTATATATATATPTATATATATPTATATATPTPTPTSPTPTPTPRVTPTPRPRPTPWPRPTPP